MPSPKRHGDAEIFPDEIKHPVAGNGKDQDACLPAAIFGCDFRRVSEHDGGRGGPENSEPAKARSWIGRISIGQFGNHALTVLIHLRSVQQRNQKLREWST